jgi:pentatricopeptide repeat protein
MKLGITILLSLAVFIIEAQISMERYLERAEAYYCIKQYSMAIPDFERFLSKNVSMSVSIKLANCYLKTNNMEKALELYKEIILKKEKPDTLNLIYADLLKQKGEYRKAKEQYLLLYNFFPSRILYKLYAQYCDSTIYSITNMNPIIQIQHLSNINSIYSDVAPTKYKNGIVFSSNRENTLIKKKTGNTNLPLYDLFLASGKDSLFFNQVEPFSARLNTIHHECCASFTSDYKKIFYTRSIDQQPGDGNGIKNTLKMFSAVWENNGWQNPHSFRFNDTTHSYGQPTVEANEELFFFTSDRLGGFGGTDLYVCFNIDHKWTDPINLGKGVNTPYNELFPFFHPDGTLYFSSNRPEGYGGYDIYKAIENDNGDYESAINMGFPINSSFDDLSIYWNSEYSLGYFSSNRPGGLGLEDIYRIQKK